MKPIVALSLACATILPLVAGCNREKAVASVDGDSISIDEFNQYLATKRTVRVLVQGQAVEVPVAETLGFQALQELATQRIVLHMAQEAGFRPTEKEIEDEINLRKAVNPNYLTNLKAGGYSHGQIRREVAYSLAEERLLTRGTKVGMEEVDRMMKEKPEQFMQPATADVYQIYVLSESRKDQAEKELKASQSFKSVAEKYNQAPEGSKVRFQTAKLPDNLRKLIVGSPIGSSTDWIPVKNGWGKYYIESRTEAVPMEMTPERKEYVRRQIALQYGKQANDLGKQVAEKLRSSKVLVSDDEETLKNLWKRFEDRLEKVSADGPKN